ncbi:MAG: patatin-like phospholipase family protein [Bacteroidota bacterium]
MRATGALEEKYPNDGLIRIVDEMMGDVMLSEVRTNVIVPAYHTEQRIPWFFKSYNAKDRGKDYDFKIRDVALATAAPPTYFEPHKVPHKDSYLSLIDGGIFANNPSLCALVDAIDEEKFNASLEDVFILSLGTGEYTRIYSYDDIVDWGLFRWARPVLNCVFDGANDTVDYQLRKLLNSENYTRLQCKLDKANDDLDDAGSTNLMALRRLAEVTIDENRDELEKIVDSLLK